MSGLRIEDIAALLGGLGAPNARAERKPTKDDFDLARDITNQAVLVLVSQKIDAATIFAAMGSSLANVLATYIKPEGVDRVIDQLAATLKTNTRKKQATLAGLGFMGAPNFEPAKAEPAEAKPAASDWIEWKGGKCPTTSDTIVEVCLRSGKKMTERANDLGWGHDEDEGDIMRYRVIF